VLKKMFDEKGNEKLFLVRREFCRSLLLLLGETVTLPFSFTLALLLTLNDLLRMMLQYNLDYIFIKLSNNHHLRIR
jgi:hypothetical protein